MKIQGKNELWVIGECDKSQLGIGFYEFLSYIDEIIIGKVKDFQGIPINISRLYLDKKFLHAIGSETHSLALSSLI